MMMFPDLAPALPEIILAISALVLVLIGAFAGERSTGVVTALSVAVLAFVALVLIFYPAGGSTFSDAFVLDPFARFMKVVVTVTTMMLVIMLVMRTEDLLCCNDRAFLLCRW